MTPAQNPEKLPPVSQYKPKWTNGWTRPKAYVQHALKLQLLHNDLLEDMLLARILKYNVIWQHSFLSRLLMYGLNSN